MLMKRNLQIIQHTPNSTPNFHHTVSHIRGLDGIDYKHEIKNYSVCEVPYVT